MKIQQTASSIKETIQDYGATQESQLTQELFYARAYGKVDRSLYKCRPVRFIAVTALTVSIALLALSYRGSIHSIPQRISGWFKGMPQWKIAVIGGSSGATLLALTLIFVRAIHAKDRLWEDSEVAALLTEKGVEPPKTRGSICGQQKHLYPCYIRGHYQKNGELRPAKVMRMQNIDTSTLDKNGNGVALSYFDKGPFDTDIISTGLIEASLLTPFFMAYNAIRTVGVTFYILGKMATQKRDLPPEEKFRWKHIPQQVGLSLWRVVKMPFYTLAINLAAIYTLYDPHAGRKLVAAIERDANAGIIREKSWWIAQGCQKGFKWEGGGTPAMLGKSAYYTAGCYQPGAVMIFENWDIVHATPLHGKFPLRVYTSENVAPDSTLTEDDIRKEGATAINGIAQHVYEEGDKGLSLTAFGYKHSYKRWPQFVSAPVLARRKAIEILGE